MKKTYLIEQDQQKTITLNKSGDYTVKLTGKGASATITGAFWLKGSDKLHLNLTIIHSAPNTTVNTTLKAIAEDESKIELHGTIIVKLKAQQTNSFLSEKVLLLSDKAQAHAIPNLEIEANDVKCSHAVTVSNIDEDQLFYLQSRGVSKKQAQNLIAAGFLK